MELITKNDINIILEQKRKTPRCGISCFFEVTKPEKYSGTFALFARLLFQGTTTKTGLELSLDLEENGIEMSANYKQNYFKLSTLCLNEDLEKTLDIMSDIFKNSTFEDFEKEVFKMKGELTSELDNPKVKLTDKFVREFYKNHPYANTRTKILEKIDSITKEDMLEIKKHLSNSKKVISFVGDFETKEKMAEFLSQKLDFMQNNGEIDEFPKTPEINGDEIFKIEKNDSNQAQIIQGWKAETIDSKDYPKLVVMNNILGSSGLSSRLFYELRDKQGLAYHVRSSYEVSKHGAMINFYIATSPDNIKKCLDGFQIEIKKLQEIPPNDEELLGGKENVIGKLDYLSQTNIQQANSNGYDWIMGLGLNYDEKYKKMINEVTAKDVSDMAKKYLSGKSVTVVLAPKEYLNF